MYVAIQHTYVYARGMQGKPLSPEDWLDAALDALRTDGYGALKAQPLAKRLQVTRGSFYYHFDSLDAFHRAVVAHWSVRTTGPVATAAAKAGDPQAALDALLQTTLQSGEALERAIRSWATVAPDVATAVSAVDAARIKVAEDLLLQGGLAPHAAAPRAKLLYWAAIGRLMLPFPQRNRMSPGEVSELAALMWQDVPTFPAQEKTRPSGDDRAS